MKVERLYTYPIKSFRATSATSAEVSKHGFLYDRRFMVLQVLEDDDGKTSLKIMAVANYPEMVLFFTALDIPLGDASKGKITVTYKPPKDTGKQEKTLDVPLKPDTKGLDTLEINMLLSPTKAYRMGSRYDKWLSDCFGYDVAFVYLGENTRQVLMSTSGNTSKQPPPTTNGGMGWLSSMASTASSLISSATGQENSDKPKEITFADCAPYLIVSSTSMKDVHSRLPDGQEMDITKFRPNIIVSGAEETWEEDYWAELTIKSTTGDASTVFECVHNCARCKSINIDYATGKPGEGDAGSMLKMLQSDRRVDSGAKWSPIFGRYSFLGPGSDGSVIGVGDEVVVSRRNEERTRFDWKGPSTK